MALAKPTFPAKPHGTLASGLVLGMPFYEGSGLTANDLSGNGNNGTLSGGVTWTSGPFGNALSFNGSTGYASVSSAAPLNFGTSIPFTVAFWVNTSSSSTQRLINKGDAGSGSFNGWDIHYNSIPHAIRCVIGDGTGKFLTRDGSTNIADGKWHFVAVTVIRGGATSDVQVYVDCKKDSMSTAASTATTLTNLTNSDAVIIGVDAAKASQWLSGSLDSSLIFNRALSADEIAALFYDSFSIYRRSKTVLKAAGGGPFTVGTGHAKPTFPAKPHGPLASGLVLGLPLYEGSGGTVNDLSGNGKNSTLNGTVTWTGGPFGTCLLFDGSSGYINLGAPGLLNAAGATSISLWIRPTVSQNGYLWTQYDGSGSGTGASGKKIIWNSTGKIGIRWSSGSPADISSVGTAPLNTWTHIVAVFAASGTGSIYLNGQLDTSGSLGTEATTTNNVRISGRWGVTPNTGNGVMFGGNMDAVAYWNRALSRDEIAALFYDSFSIYRRSRTILKSAAGPVATLFRRTLYARAGSRGVS